MGCGSLGACYNQVMQRGDFIKIEEIVDDRIERHLGIFREVLNDQFILLHEGQQNILEILERNLREHREAIDHNKLNIDNNSLAILDHSSRIKILERNNKKLYV